MSKWLHISSQDTMHIAERLYQAGYISYPRTETNKFPPNFDFHTLIQEQTQSAQWGDYATRLLDNGEFRTPKAGQDDDTSHPPIHPLKFVDNLEGRDAQIYEFIVRHYLACCSQDALGHETVVEVSMGPEIFKCTGLAIQALNFLEVYRYQKWSDTNIPNFELGEMVTPTKLVMEEGKTTAPPLLTEADLIQLMNQNGIGTDATIAEHIATIISRNYVVKKGTRMEMSPTQLGEALVAGYNFIGYRRLNQPQLRASLEADLKRICLRQIDKNSVLKQQIEMYKAFFVEVRTKVLALDKALSKYFPPSGSIVLQEERNFSKCGRCGSLMALRLGKNETNFMHCATCNLTLRLPQGEVANKIAHDVAPPTFQCPICNYQVLSFTAKNGKVLHVCPYCFSNPPDHVKPHLKMDAATGDVQDMPCYRCTHQGCPLKGGSISYDSSPIRNCPACTSPMIIRQSKNMAYYLACSNYPTCRKAIWFPLETVKEVKPTGTPCPSCTQKPSSLVEIRYSDREAFENGKNSDIGCMYGCAGGSRAVKSLLDEVTNGLATWETSAPPPAPAEPRGFGNGANTKATGAKRTNATNFGLGRGTAGTGVANRNYVYSGSGAGNKSTASTKATGAKRGAAKSGGSVGGSAKYPSKATGKATSSANRALPKASGAPAGAKTTTASREFSAAAIRGSVPLGQAPMASTTSRSYGAPKSSGFPPQR
jgi:DNA topoisomerase-3